MLVATTCGGGSSSCSRKVEVHSLLVLRAYGQQAAAVVPTGRRVETRGVFRWCSGISRLLRLARLQ